MMSDEIPQDKAAEVQSYWERQYRKAIQRIRELEAELAKDDDLQHQTNMAVIELRNELARVQAVVTCAAEDLEARASLEGEHTACAMMCIAKVLTAALDKKVSTSRQAADTKSGGCDAGNPSIA